MFPVIKTIDDILPHIAGFENFYVNYKDDYSVVDYVLNTPDMFNDPVQKECRGLLFHKDGTIMSRPFHKFFNLNERPESSIENIDISKKHRILEKLDGSMIRPVFSEGRWTWGSKAGITFLTPQIEEFMQWSANYETFAFGMAKEGFTCIFEWCSNKNRIVISHPQDRLVLLAIRDNVLGFYMDYDFLLSVSKDHDIEVVKEFDGTVRNMLHLSDTVKEMTGIEGFVVRFDDGQMIKIKCDEYVLHHKAKDKINLEKNVIAIIVNNQADDFRTLLTPDDRSRFEAFEKDFNDNLLLVSDAIFSDLKTLKNKEVTKKMFGMGIQEEYPKIFRSIFFKYLEKSIPNITDIFIDINNLIKKNISSQSHVDNARVIWNNLKWEDYK